MNYDCWRILSGTLKRKPFPFQQEICPHPWWIILLCRLRPHLLETVINLNIVLPYNKSWPNRFKVILWFHRWTSLHPWTCHFLFPPKKNSPEDLPGITYIYRLFLFLSKLLQIPNVTWIKNIFKNTSLTKPSFGLTSAEVSYPKLCIYHLCKNPRACVPSVQVPGCSTQWLVNRPGVQTAKRVFCGTRSAPTMIHSI